MQRNSSILTSKIHDAIKAIPGIFRFRLHKHEVPLLTTLGAIDRCCITFCVSGTELEGVTIGLSRIYQQLKAETANMPKQELQRVIPLFWSGSKSVAPAFSQHSFIAFLDVRSCTKQHKSKIQEIFSSMDIPYDFQKRSVLVLYASGAILENFRQNVFQQHIILPFGKEEGCFQCAFSPSSLKDACQVDIQPIGNAQYEAYQVEDDGTLMVQDGPVNPELASHLSTSFGVSHIRPAVVHIQGKGQQKVVAFIVPASILPHIPSIFRDHQGGDRILQYKQPNVHSDAQTSHIYLKEMRADFLHRSRRYVCRGCTSHLRP